MSATKEPEADEFAADVARLEAALERIADISAMGVSRAAEIANTATPAQGGAIDTTAIVRRLDNMIARLRAAIDEA
jgi:hypothetical protein